MAQDLSTRPTPPAPFPWPAPAASNGLSSNENPYPPLDDVLAVAQEQVRSMNRYPSRHPDRLVGALSSTLDVPAEDITTGCGSVAVIQQLVHAAVLPGDEIVYAWRSFDTYPRVSRIQRAEAVQVPLRDHRHDLAAMATAITSRTAAVIVCNPNNPTGTMVDAEELERFVRQVPPRVLIILDEAYREFADPALVPDGVELYRRYPNVTAVRTFSKAYGLAGLRVGYSITHRPLAEKARLCAIPFGVSAAAEAAALASLRDRDAALDRVRTLVAERDHLVGRLARAGWSVPPSQANFVWLPLGPSTDLFAETCRQAGLDVRPYPGEGVRVTVGHRSGNDLVVEVAREFTARHGITARAEAGRGTR